ncbi:MAG TPA: hydrogenase maturation nickel metallochaperone HypA [Terriglobales bacterium]|jgi:hydrogenase nickel incorporation protein HypA/HybF|nr:hydrogenase maturation nickel metallochaperone HypA [Terriglobales bacterium]
MHEMGIACEVLAAARREAQKYPGRSPRKVGVRIGELTAVDPEALRFCFEVITRDSEMQPLELEIEICPFRFRCLSCGHEFVVRNYETQCPQCAGIKTECIGGQELDLAYLEVEDYEPCAAGAKSTQ